MSSDDDFLDDSSDGFLDDSDEFVPESKPKSKAVAEKKKPAAKPTSSSSSRGGGTAAAAAGRGIGRGRGGAAAKIGRGGAVSSSTTTKQSTLQFADPSDDSSDDPPSAKRTSKEVDVGSKYKKVSQLEHVLLRPDTYVGSIEKTTSTMWIWEEDHMVRREIEWVPGLYKIFDEILVNAADCAINDPDCDTIKISIDVEGNTISVWNNGKGIPVQIHPTEQIYVPEMIFGHLLTSSNYDDKEEKVTGGRNGFGAKLANIFSTEFTVETVDSVSKKKYSQRFSGNMANRDPAKITAASIKSGYTQITFKPDLGRFGLSVLSDDMVGLMRKRTYDLAGTGMAKMKVYLNGVRLPIRTFKQYVELYTNSPSNVQAMGAPVLHEKISDRWEIAITRSDGSQFEQVSFVNSICTPRGGSHVDHVVTQLMKYLGEAAKKKTKTPIRPQHIKLHLFVFVKSLIVNPAFDSQCKETLTSKVSNFGSRCNLDDVFMKKLGKLGIIDAIVASANSKADAQLAKTGGTKKSRLTGFTKLDDANDAGTRKAESCTLILTEGDSAKTLAIAGLSVVGRDSYGVFPLRGKLLNARDASSKMVADNKELKALTQIIGLHYGKKYDTIDQIKSLRYGSILIMTDQDVDGSHIKGLVINWLHAYWPQLIKRPGFVREFITPIVKAKKGTQTQTFFTLPEYLNWKVAHNGAKGWTIKYYKGLGTSSPTEAREYFGNLPRHLIQFHYTGQNDDKRIEMAFSKKDKAADERKNWLRTYNPGTFLDQNVSQVSYSDFIDKELILFSHADCIRSIPHLLDGFKPGQRKVLYGCFKKNLKNEVKVAQLSGYIGEHAAYHHGEISLQDTIVKMAQTFVGSNNLALLFPAGMFGSRLMGGKDHASARYINTRLSKVARAVFHEADDHLLTYLDDDGFTIEPEYYVPIIPMVLVNGAEGIGTGWSTSVPTYSPYDLIDALRALIQGQEPKPLHPYFRGFYGRVETQPNEPGCYLVRGCWDILEDEELTIRIWELPVKMWTSNFKKFLELCIEKNQISNYREYHTETKVHFTIQLSPEQFKAIDAAGIEKFFKLHSRVLTTNMHLYSGEDNQITHFTSARQILDAYYDIRLVFYSRRKEYLVAQLTEEVQRLENKCRFIQMVIDGHLEIRNKPKSEIVLQLQKHKFKLISQSIANRKTIREGNTDQILTTYEAEADASGSEDEAGSSQQADISKLITGYDYLLSMKLWALSKESIQKLRNQAAERTQELRVLLQTSPQQMWLNDLKNLEEILDTIEAAEYQSSIAVVAAASSGSVLKKRDRNTQNKKLKSVLPPHPADDLPFAKRSVVSVGRIGDSGITVEKRATERRPRSTQNQASASFDDSLNNSSMLANEDIPKSLASDNSQHVSSSSASSSSSSSSSIAPVVAKKEPVKKEPVKKEPVKKEPVKKEPIKKPVASVVKLPTATAKPAAPKSRKKVISDSDEESSSFEPSQDSDDWQPSPPKKSLVKKPSRNIIDSDDEEPALSKAPVARSKAPEPVKVEKALSSKPQAAPPARTARAAAVKASQNLVIEDDSLSDPSPLSDFDL